VEPVVTFPTKHETDVVGLGFAATGQFVMSCDDKTTLIIWSIRGEVRENECILLDNTYIS